MKLLINVFGSLKQKVLWKYEKDDLENLPSNLMISKWTPQAEILNHPNVVLFISHGGLFGTIESLHFGVTTLFMPFFGDQYRNAKMAEKLGYGHYILFSHMTENSLKSKIDEMIGNKKYLEKAKEMSYIVRDNQVSPLNTSMYWIEYVIKNNGAKHLKSHAIELSWYQYLMLDVVCFIALNLWIIFKGAELLYQFVSKRMYNKMKVE